MEQRRNPSESRRVAVLVAVILVLSGAFVVYVLEQSAIRDVNREDYAQRRTRVALQQCLDGIAEYRDGTGEYPDNITDLVAFKNSERIGQNDKRDRRATLDGWGREMVVTKHSHGSRTIVGLVSRGPNGVLGDADDVRRWYPVAPEDVVAAEAAERSAAVDVK